MSVLEPTTPTPCESRYLAGLSAFESGRFDSAIEEFLVCLENDEDPRIQRLAKNYLGETHAHLGAQALREGKFAAALDHYAMAVSQAPSFPDYHLGRARALFGVGNLTEHERALRRALDLHPKYVDALLALAAIRYPASQDEGLATFEQACVASEELFGEPYHAVHAAHRAGDTALVVQTILAVSSPGAAQANSLAANAVEHQLAGREEAAEAAYLRALELAPRYADVRCKYGQLLIQLSRYADAVTELRKSVEINPRYVEGLTYLGVALVRAGHEHEGSDFLFRALEIDPLHPVATHEAAQVSIRRSSK